MALKRVGLQLKSSLGWGYVTRVLEVELDPDADQPLGHVLKNFRVLPDEVVTADLPIMHRGFFDAHLHAMWAGFKAQQADLAKARAPDELIKAVMSAKAPPSGVVQAHGWNENHFGMSVQSLAQIVEPKLPQLGPALLLRTCGHSAFVSPKLLQQLGLSMRAGLVTDKDLWQIYERLPQPSVRECERAFLLTQQRLMDLGVTAIGDMSLNEVSATALVSLAQSGLLAIDVQGVIDGGQALSFEHTGPQLVQGAKTSRVLGREPQLQIRHFKKFLDGSFGAHTAALTEAYDDAETRGELLTTLSALIDESHEALRQGFCLSFHAIGDAALDLALDLGDRLRPVLEARAQADHRPGLLPTAHRLEHAQLIRDDQLQRLSSQKFWTLVLQPHHAVADKPFIEHRLGERRLSSQAYRAQSLWAREVPLALSSDAPIDEWSPTQVLRAVCLQINQQERMSFADALWSYTTGARLHLGLSPGQIKAGELVFVSDPKNIL
jgi:predicted amidohydrolase YtcJ